MALFRLQRGSFEESLKTTVIVKNLDDIKKQVMKVFEDFHFLFPEHQVEIQITTPSYFDARCGWYTHYVRAKLSKEFQTHEYFYEYFCVGMISEPLD